MEHGANTKRWGRRPVISRCLVAGAAYLAWFAVCAEGFAFAVTGVRSSGLVRPLAATAAAETAAAVVVEEGAAAALFARLADKVVLSEEGGSGDGSGCCRSGCEGCPWRYDLPPVQRSSRPKWVVTYERREANNEQGILESHVAKWSPIFGGDGSGAVDENLFVERIKALKGLTPIGTPGFVAPNAPVDETSIRVLFAAAVASSSAEGSSELSAAQFVDFLKSKSSEDSADGLLWNNFYGIFS